MKTFLKPLSPEEEKKYLRQFKQGNIEARDILIERNMRLVAHIIKKYSFTDKDMDDLLSIGTIGLIKAVNTFNVDRGSRLATYAAKCIDNEILMMLRNEKKYSRDVSLYEPIGTDSDGGEISLLDIIEIDDRDIIDQVSLKIDTEKLYKAFDICLSAKEQLVVKMRYGLLGSDEFTQREIANLLGISRSYVSRIEKGALNKLKSHIV